MWLTSTLTGSQLLIPCCLQPGHGIPKQRGCSHYIYACVSNYHFHQSLSMDFYNVQSAKATQILLTGVFSCLMSWAVSSDQWQRQPKSCLPGSSVAFGHGRLHRINGRGNQNPSYRGLQLPLVMGGFIESMAEATKILLTEVFSCLWSWASSLDQWQRQLKSCLPRSSVAFGLIKLLQHVEAGNMLNF